MVERLLAFSRKGSDFWFGLGFVLLAALFYTQTLHLPPSMVRNSIGSAFFPRILLIAIAVLGGVLMLRRRRENQGVAAEPAGLRPYLLFGWLCVFLMALPYIGYYVATAVLQVGILLLFDERRWWIYPVAVGGFLLFVYLIFDRALGVLLPRGAIYQALG